ncbi:hypothetical protein KVT40_002958 [Elsinoe batatas]|uniref:Signal peptide peptidase n=1 Tax=Elsinoe batatas TaxID=2601811 RepID=A0A8K0LB99_9PEZI|nr:hypothetical protein KVT40_002958 [Elsinoe batatas]
MEAVRRLLDEAVLDLSQTYGTVMDSMPAPVMAALPYLPMSIHLVVSALIPIYTGSYASLSRPSSTMKPAKRSSKSKRSKLQDGSSDSDAETSGSDDEENDIVTKMEGMSPSDAILFPLLAGCTLAGLYMLIKYMGAALLNKILAIYFGAMAFFSVARMVNDVLAVTQNFVFPKYYCANSLLWKVDQKRRVALPIGTSIRAARPGIERAMQARREDPLPGSWGGRSPGSGLVDLLWRARGLLDKKYIVAFHLREVADIKARVSLRSIASSVIAVMVLLYANFISTPWYLTNLQGFAFSYTALQLLSPTTFGTGSLILVALFFYDIYFVFYTPLMVSVATNLDVPIKLLFPRPEEEGKKPGLAMLGLGDVVLPGIMIGLALRFDLYLHYRRRQHIKENAQGKDEVDKPKYVSVTGKWGDYHWVGSWLQCDPLVVPSSESRQSDGYVAPRNFKQITIDDILPRFSRTYFHASIAGYVLGMSVTLIIMHVFKHAQPALLYLVPGVLGSVWSTALVKGEVKEMWEYTELVEDDDEQDDKKEKSKRDEKQETQTEKPEQAGKWFSDFFSTSFFGSAKQERNAKRLEDSIKRSMQPNEEASQKPKSKSTPTTEDKQKGFFNFTITPAPPRQSRREGKVLTEAKADEVAPSEKDEPRRRSARLTRTSSGSEGSDDAVLINKADAASFIDEGTSARKRKAKA